MKDSNKEWVEHIEDMCGGYYIAHKGELSVLILAGESASDAIKRAENERLGS